MHALMPRGHSLSLFVARSGARWEVRISPDFDAAFAYGSAEAALDVARSAARSHWEKWGFPCAVFTRGDDAQDWQLAADFGSADAEACGPGGAPVQAHGTHTAPGE